MLQNNNTSGTLTLDLDPTTLGRYPIGFTTTLVPWIKNNWALKADPTWNTFSSDVPVGPDGLTIRVNSQGLFEVVPPVTSSTDTTTTVTSSAIPSVFDQAITLTATVTGTTPGANIPTGSVSFSDGSAILGTSTLDSTGTATWTTSDLAVGSHRFTAAHGGDANFAASTGSDFMTEHIFQTALVIGGTAGSPAAVTIAASDASGNPLIASPVSLLGALASSGLSLANSLTLGGPFETSDISSGSPTSVVGAGRTNVSQSGLSSIAVAANDATAKPISNSPIAVAWSAVPTSEPLFAAAATAAAGPGDSAALPFLPPLRAPQPVAPASLTVPEPPVLRAQDLVFETLSEAEFRGADPDSNAAAISSTQRSQSESSAVA